MRLLLVEDNALLGDGLKAGLEQQGYIVDWVKSSTHARQALFNEQFDLLVLDLGLPDEDGINVLKWLRQSDSNLPVLILTARDHIDARISGLDNGADDYMTKPFNLDELSARLRAIQRRSVGIANPVIEHGDIELNPSSKSVKNKGETVTLTAHEYHIFEKLLMNQSKVFSKTQLEEAMYGWSEGVESNAIEVHIHHLRQKLGKTIIKTIRGIGYLIP